MTTVDQHPTARWRLVRPAIRAVEPPRLDSAQQKVVDHRDGPLLVLAGPGTGKTTTLVEAVVARIEEGIAPDQVLVLTFGRRAADELRERIAMRIGRTVVEPSAFTFHAFCLSVVRAHATTLGAQPPRLLSGAEREVRIAELLRGNAAGEGQTRWPTELKEVLRLRGFARELADLIDRARERGLDADGLRKLGEGHDRPAWSAAGDFLDEYLDVLEFRDEVDYAGLVATASDLLAGPMNQLRGRWQAIYVDEYQDTDPAQEALLRLIAGEGRPLVVVGDPDQSIYRFRGAEVDNICDFGQRFAHPDGSDAPVVSLAISRRMAKPLLDVSRELARRIPLGSLTSQRTAHRALEAAGPTAAVPPRIRLFASGADEAAAIADLLRRAHLVDGLRWDQMAVLVRSGVRSIPVLKRALVAAGVPVSVASDEIAVASDPAVAPLIAALGVAVARTLDEGVTADTARMLLLSPLGGATPSGLRALGRRLRDRDRDAGRVSPRPSADLIRAAVVDPGCCEGIEDWIAAPVRQLFGLLSEARELVGSSAAPDEVLWCFWHRSGWARRLAVASSGSGAAARAADRDLDAVVALFDAAVRLEDRKPRAGASALLEDIAAQEIPAGPMSERPSSDGAVRLLTAHRSKGLEWDLVVVAGVQESVWPDLRRRGSLLDADLIDRSPDGRASLRPPPSPSMLLADERRLFYVAVTRARRRLVVTAVADIDDGSERPSRFLDELGLELPEAVEPAGVDLLSAPSLVARLRRAVTDSFTGRNEGAAVDAGPTRSQRAALAASLLARLSGEVDDRGRPLVPAADPSNWWGVLDRTEGPKPLRDPEKPIRLSGSAVASFLECPRKWFLDREVKAGGASSSAQGFGSMVHALAEAVATGELPADADTLVNELDEVWSALPFDSPWQRIREHDEAVALIDRFLRWHNRNSRDLIGVEREFDIGIAHADADCDAHEVILHGRADRVERDAAGRVVIVDLKTGKTSKTDNDVQADAQLGVYQLATLEGAFADLADGAPGGAELVQLRQVSRGEAKVQQQKPLDADQEDGIAARVREVAEALRSETLPARPNKRCNICAFRDSCPAADGGDRVVT